MFRNKTLNGGRAERNEYILLHEFHRLKYICPDKTWGKKTTPKIAKEEFEDDGELGGGGKGKGKGKGGKPKRDKYKGGLVFEPKRGLWDRYVLVMDFNSLYPSIIQEYNIDFSTVSSIEDAEDLAVQCSPVIHQSCADPGTCLLGRGEDPGTTCWRRGAGRVASSHCHPRQSTSSGQVAHEGQDCDAAEVTSGPFSRRASKFAP